MEVGVVVEQHVGGECGLGVEEGAGGDGADVEDEVGHGRPTVVDGHTLTDLLHDPA